MEKFLILGAGVYQLPLIEAVKSRGLHSIVASRAENYPGIELADTFLEIDTTDRESILAAAKRFSISGIATTGSDVCIPSIGYTVDSLGLSGTGFDASLKSMNKRSMKEAFHANLIPSSKFRVAKTIAEVLEFRNEIGFPMAIKACDSSGSRGISRVDNEEQIEGAFNESLEISNEEFVIVEEWLEGVEFGVQAVVSNGEVIDMIFHNDQTTSPPKVVPIGHSVPFSMPELKEESRKIIQNAISALGINQTVANVDLLQTPEGTKILEIGSRIGATCIPELCESLTGVNFYEVVVDLALGKIMSDPFPRKSGAWAAILIRSRKHGNINPMPQIPEELCNEFGITSVQMDYEFGGGVHEFSTGDHRIGHLLSSSDSVEGAEEAVFECERKYVELLEWSP